MTRLSQTFGQVIPAPFGEITEDCKKVFAGNVCGDKCGACTGSRGKKILHDLSSFDMV